MEAYVKVRALWDHLRMVFETAGMLDEVFETDSEEAARNLRFNFYNKRRREIAKNPDDPFNRAIRHARATIYQEDGRWFLRIQTVDQASIKPVSSALDAAMLQKMGEAAAEKTELKKPQLVRKEG